MPTKIAGETRLRPGVALGVVVGALVVGYVGGVSGVGVAEPRSPQCQPPSLSSAVATLEYATER